MEPTIEENLGFSTVTPQGCPAMLSIVVTCCLFAATVPAVASELEAVNFSRDIRPLLADRCFKCHGPDAAQRQASLRLDRRAGAIEAAESGDPPIVPQRPADSTLLARIASDDPDERMPPASEGKRLTNEQIDLIRRWIEQGAAYTPHWSFVAPQRPTLPNVHGHVVDGLLS